MKKSHPIRMCVNCRIRYPQRELIRLKQQGNELIGHDGMGRSIYLCNTCKADEKKIKGFIKRFRQNRETVMKLLEELTDNG